MIRIFDADFLDEIPRLCSFMGDLRRAVQRNDICAGFDDRIDFLHRRGDEDIGVIMPDLVETDDRKIGNRLLYLTDLFGGIDAQSDSAGPLCAFRHLYHHVFGVDRFILLGLTGYDQAAFQAVEQCFLFRIIRNHRFFSSTVMKFFGNFCFPLPLI